MSIDVKENILMNFLRKMDDLGHSLASSQARMFERSVEDGIPSYFFIKSFMASYECSMLDELNLESAGINEVEIYDVVSKKVKIRRGEILSYPIMHFIGYFYRSASYLLDVSSKYLLENISPKILMSNYLTIHSLPIEEAVKEIFSICNIEIKSKEDIFFDIYKSIN